MSNFSKFLRMVSKSDRGKPYVMKKRRKHKPHPNPRWVAMRDAALRRS